MLQITKKLNVIEDTKAVVILSFDVNELMKMHWALRMDAKEDDKEEICKFDNIIENVEDSFGFNVYAFVENALDVEEDTKIMVEDIAATL